MEALRLAQAEAQESSQYHEVLGKFAQHLLPALPVVYLLPALPVVYPVKCRCPQSDWASLALEANTDPISEREA